MVNDHQPPGPVGPHEGCGLLRLGGVPDLVYLWTVAAAKMVADRDLHDLLQDAVGDRGPLSLVAGRRTCGLTRGRNGSHFRLGSSDRSHRALGVCIQELRFVVKASSKSIALDLPQLVNVSLRIAGLRNLWIYVMRPSAK